ncbi:unannotated protein [freshwater metagenome]|uniref:Unannotated protein n=1 Tax=freshwater metagenome TaxID=449393 RepID=A0A6J7UDX6_9ZZZZ
MNVLLAFTQQLSSFVEAGIPMVESLDIALGETDDATMKATIVDIRSSVERGSSFADAVSKHTRVFPAFYRAMLRSADFTGNLNEVLNQAGVYLERDITARKQIKSALTYPMVVVCVAIIAVVLMAAFVLPKFADLYKSVNAKLPLPTRMLLGITDFFNNYWWAIFLGLAGVGVLAMATLGGNANKRRRDGLFWNAPGLGSLVRSVSVERFCRVLAALTRAGVPLTESLEVAAESTNSTVFSARMASVREDIVRGSGLSDSMRKTELFPNTAQQMIDVGERTGGLSNQLGRAAVYYEREVSQRIKRLTDLFEPLVIMFIGLVVGFVAIAQVAAMYSVFSQIK